VNWQDKLKTRWSLKSTSQVWVILVVFALTGTSVVVFRRYLKANYEWANHAWFTFLYYWLILPFYNLLLLAYGWVFGKFSFFWEFEKKFFNRIVKLIKK